MKYLTRKDIQDHLRLDDAQAEREAALLDIYGEAAEETVLSLCRTTVEGLVEEYGDIPASIRHASLLLVDVAFQYRSPISPGNVSMVPYTIDILLKPYMKLV